MSEPCVQEPQGLMQVTPFFVAVVICSGKSDVSLGGKSLGTAGNLQTL